MLGEDNFIESMNTDNLEWQKTCTRQGSFRSFDGTLINYYFAVPEKPRAVVTILHGFCEFWAKYHEYAWYLYQAGYAVFLHEQRGHGYSEGKTGEPDVVYIDDYDTYVTDFRCFLDRVVIPSSQDLPKILLAHSMGGAVVSLFLEQYPCIFHAAVLSSPMIAPNLRGVPVPLASMMAGFARLLGKEKKNPFFMSLYAGPEDFSTSCATDQERFAWYDEVKASVTAFQNSVPSYQWSYEALHVTEKILAPNRGRKAASLRRWLRTEVYPKVFPEAVAGSFLFVILDLSCPAAKEKAARHENR